MGRQGIRDYLAVLADRGGEGGAAGLRATPRQRNDVFASDEVSAEVRSYFPVLTDQGLDHAGRYRDRITSSVEGTWRFEHRYVRLDAPPRSELFTTTFVNG